MASTRSIDFQNAQIASDSRQYDHLVFGAGAGCLSAGSASTYGLQHFSPLQLDCPTGGGVLCNAQASTSRAPLKAHLSALFRRVRREERFDDSLDDEPDQQTGNAVA